MSRPPDLGSLVFKMGRKTSLLVICLGESEGMRLVERRGGHVVTQETGTQYPGLEIIIHI